MPLRRQVLATLAAWSALVAGAQAQTAPQSLVGEVFTGSVTVTEATCDAEGVSTVSFRSTGTALGPYPGTYEEQGTVRLGPQTGRTVSVLGTTFTTGPVEDVQVTFKVFSLEGEVLVTGTKSADPAVVGLDMGVCVDFSAGELTGPFVFDSGSLRMAQSGMRYDATIHAEDGAYRDTGTATWGFTHTQICSANGLTCGRAGGPFTEQFMTSSGVVPLNTPGKATGGGQILGLGPGPVTFGFRADSDEERRDGRCVVVAKPGPTIRCLDVTSYTQIGNRALFSGPASMDGAPTTYRIEVADNAEPGAGADTFTITTDSGFTATGVLTHGNIQVHAEE